MAEKLQYSFGEAAKALSVSRDTIYRWVKKGALPAPHYICGKPFFRADELQAVVDRLFGRHEA